MVERLNHAIHNPLLARQLASTVILDEMYDMLIDGDVESIRLWLDAGVDVDIATEDGRTPLILTCYKGHVALVKLLIDAGADKEKADSGGFTPLFVVCQEGHEEVVRMLLGEGADKEKANNDGSTPLFAACDKGHEEVAKILLGVGANKEKADNGGFTPLTSRARRATIKWSDCCCAMEPTQRRLAMAERPRCMPHAGMVTLPSCSYCSRREPTSWRMWTTVEKTLCMLHASMATMAS